MIPCIFLCGFYGCGNLGDDAILLSLLKGLRAVMPDAELICSIGDDANFSTRLRAEWNVLRTVPRMHLPSLLRAIRESDVTVLGGGSLLQNATGTRSLCYYLSLLRMAKAFGKRTALLAGGLGPIDGKVPQRMTSSVLKRLDYASFRDRDSVLCASGFGVSLPYLSADPALLLLPQEEMLPYLPPRFFLSCLRKKTNIPPLRAAETILSLETLHGAVPVFYDLFPREDAEYTSSVISEYYRVRKTAVRHVEALSPGIFLAAVQQSRLVYTARYHAALFAYSVGTPFEVVGDDPKLHAIRREARDRKASLTALQSDLKRFSEFLSEYQKA